MGDGDSTSDIQEQLNYWKGRCLKVEETVQEHIKKSSMKNKPTEESASLLLEEVRHVKQGLYDLDKQWNEKYISLSEKVFEDKQYSMKNNVITKGYRNLPVMSNIDFIFATACELNSLFPSLNNSIRPHHIDDAHPLPTKKNVPKKVIIKFANRWVKNEVMRCCSDLDGTSLKVTEHLTPYTLELLNSATQLVGAENTWVHNTKVFAFYKGMRYSIKNTTDLKFLISKVNLPITKNTSSAAAIPCPPTNTPLTNSNTEPIGTRTTYINNDFGTSNNNVNHDQIFSTIYKTLCFTKGRQLTTPLRGKPSRNGRGRGSYYSNSSRHVNYPS